MATSVRMSAPGRLYPSNEFADVRDGSWLRDAQPQTQIAELARLVSTMSPLAGPFVQMGAPCRTPTPESVRKA
jgi:hypothetical protein